MLRKTVGCVKSNMARRIAGNPEVENEIPDEGRHRKKRNGDETKNIPFANLIRRNVEKFQFYINRFQDTFNVTRIQEDLNVTGIQKQLFRTAVRLSKLEECFEEETIKYGFRSIITLVENSTCILGKTCRGSPEEVH